MTPQVSVVIPTYKRPDLLRRCLQALLAQTLPPDAFEVIVVDNAGTVETRDVVASLAPCFSSLRCVRWPTPPGPASARNEGCRQARAAIIAFTDDDCVPSAGWLAAGLQALVDPEADGCGGRLSVPLPDRPTDFERTFAWIEDAEFVTANCFYRKRALEEVGRFDERFTAAWREDSDLFFTLLEHGCRLVAAPDAVVVHPIEPKPWAISLRLQRKSMFNALLYKKHPRLYRERIQAAPPWAYYLALAALAVSLAAAIAWTTSAFGPHSSSAAWLAIAAGCCWLALTARFCLRRLKGLGWGAGQVLEMAFTSMLIPPLSVYWRLRGALRFGAFFL